MVKGQEPGGRPVCAVAGTCGACQHIGVSYGEQLRAKDARIVELFGPRAFAGAFEGAEIRPILGMEDPFRYRNKVISPFAPGKRGKGADKAAGKDRAADGKGKGAGKGARAERPILTGMYAAGTHRLVNTDGCPVENEQANAVVAAVRAIMQRHGVAPYDEDAGTGFMRHVVVRVGHRSGEVLVTLVTNQQEFPNARGFCRELVKRCPFVTSVVQNVNTRQTNVVLGPKEQRLYGPGFILDELCGLSFRISSQSFYQVNALQTEVLYNTAMEFAGLDGAARVVDAYCGTGTIGLVAAARGAAQVVGVDTVEAAIRDARQNARHNGVENARFVCADAGAFMRDLAERGRAAAESEQEGAAPLCSAPFYPVDVVFMDPPRAGSTEEFLDALLCLSPARVVYISCNPETQMRDLRHLVAGGAYALRTVQPVDMFPHTDHIECVALLERVRVRRAPSPGREQ